MTRYDTWPRAYGGTRIPPEQVEQDTRIRERWAGSNCELCVSWSKGRRCQSGRIVGSCANPMPGVGNMTYSFYGCDNFEKKT